jgi:site-specific DNA recombinase
MHLLDTGKLLDLKFPSFWFEDTPQGKFMLSMAFSQSKYYVDSLSENTKRGLRAKVKKGEMPGKAPWGYKNDVATKKIKVDKKKSKAVADLFSLYLKGNTAYEQGARFLAERDVVFKTGNHLRAENVKFLLTNPFYYGYFKYKDELHKGVHKPLISKRLFDRVQKVVEGRSHQPRKEKPLPFTGLIKCGDCGMMITSYKKVRYYKGTNRTAEYIYYKCTKKHKTLDCHNSPTNLPNLLPQIDRVIKDHSLPPNWKDVFLKKLKEDEQTTKINTNKLTHPLKQQLEETKVKQDRLLNLFLDNDIPQETYLSKKNQLTSKIKTLDEKLVSLMTTPNSWIEPFREWILLAHSANKISTSDTRNEEKSTFLRKTGSNLFLQERKLGCIQQNPWSALARLPTSRNLERLREIESRSFPWQGKIITVIRQPLIKSYFTIFCAFL